MKKVYILGFSLILLMVVFTGCVTLTELKTDEDMVKDLISSILADVKTKTVKELGSIYVYVSEDKPPTDYNAEWYMEEVCGSLIGTMETPISTPISDVTIKELHLFEPQTDSTEVLEIISKQASGVVSFKLGDESKEVKFQAVKVESTGKWYVGILFHGQDGDVHYPIAYMWGN